MLTQSLCAVTRTVACLRCKSGHRHPNSQCVRIHAPVVWCHRCPATSRGWSSFINDPRVGGAITSATSARPNRCARGRPPPARGRGVWYGCGSAGGDGGDDRQAARADRRRRRRLSAWRDLRGGAPSQVRAHPQAAASAPPVPSDQTRPGGHVLRRGLGVARLSVAPRPPCSSEWQPSRCSRSWPRWETRVGDGSRLPSSSYRNPEMNRRSAERRYEVGADPLGN